MKMEKAISSCLTNVEDIFTISGDFQLIEDCIL